MPSSREYLSYIMEQLAPLEGITTRQMMGEYIIYYQGKIAAELCDDRLLVKPVPAALALLPKKLRRKKSTRITVICMCSVIAIALAGYLLLTAIFLDAAYHH